MGLGWDGLNWDAPVVDLLADVACASADPAFLCVLVHG